MDLHSGMWTLLLLVSARAVLSAPDGGRSAYPKADGAERYEEDTRRSRTLLSRLYGPLSFSKMRNSFGGYTCTTPALIKPGDVPPVMTFNGILSSMTAVLVGYGPDETLDTFRGNKGFIYGVGGSDRFGPRSKHPFSFTVDYAPPADAVWDREEFCVLIFSPALRFGPSLTSAIGKPSGDRRRYFGSSENIVSALLRESPQTRSKFVSQCCFIMSVPN